MEHQDIEISSGPKPQLERLPSPGAATSPDQPASVDAWLERRLRVFERALAALEARREKSERELSRRVALLEEWLAAYEKRAEAVPELAAAGENKMESAQAEAAQGPVPEIGSGPSPSEMGDLVLGRARGPSSAAAIVVSASSKAKGAPRWMAWSAVGCAAAMTMTALALGNVAGASEPQGGVSHRHEAQAFGRVIALADSGDPRDQTMLAFAYLRGQHVASDHQAAGRWALAAAEDGDPRAQYLLGAFYQSGDGVATNPAEAFHWFETAALGGNLKAMHNLAIAYVEGQGTAKDPERAAAWFNRAAEQGYTDSQFDLAVLYERGDGVSQNPQSALKWYLIAARAGDKEAASRAAQLEQAMAPSDVRQADMAAGAFLAQPRDPVANSL
jgi:TPR repeat protein